LKEDKSMLSIAILDDNLNVLEDYERKIPIWLKKNNISGQIVVATTSYRDFVREVRDQAANVCIMDINLNSEVNGLYIANQIRKEGIKCEIIFCSGMLEFLPKVFDVHAYNFIPKPINNSLEKCLLKLNNEIENRQVSRTTIEIKFGSRIYYVPVDSITHFAREGSKTIITTINRVLEVYDSLEAFSTRLNDDRFVQCHRSTIINKDFIDFVDIKTKTVHISTGHSFELGSKYYSNFNCKGDSLCG
jgi:DNA-binding LytR/AlgR family response regulator